MPPSDERFSRSLEDGTETPCFRTGALGSAIHTQVRKPLSKFQKILGHRGIVVSDPIGALAHPQSARAYALQGDVARQKPHRDSLMLRKGLLAFVGTSPESRADLSLRCLGKICQPLAQNILSPSRHYPEIIPGAHWIPPKEVLENPSLIPKEKEVAVYCTCTGEKTSRAVLHRALSMHFTRIKFLKGGFAAWKAKDYPVEPYREVFHLYTPSVAPR